MGLFDEIMSASGSDNNGIINGIVTGIVKDNYDKENPGKIKVELFLGERGKNVTGWVSVMTPYAGTDFGYYSLPEVGSEVVVAFNMGDRNCPIVIGCLWNGKNKLPTDTVTDKNVKKRFITKGKNEILIDDTDNKQVIEIKTAKGKAIIFNEEKDNIIIHDKDNKNSIIVSSKDGTMTLEAEKKIILKAGGENMAVFDGTGKKVTIDSNNIDVKAGQNLNLKGQSVKVDGTNVAIKGTGSFKAESSGTTQVKGTIVKIN